MLKAHNNLGNALKDLNQLDAALKSYEQCTRHYNRTLLRYITTLVSRFKELGQLDAALKSYEQTLAIKPDYTEAFNNLGSVLKEL